MLSSSRLLAEVIERLLPPLSTYFELRKEEFWLEIKWTVVATGTSGNTNKNWPYLVNGSLRNLHSLELFRISSVLSASHILTLFTGTANWSPRVGSNDPEETSIVQDRRR